MKEVVSYDAYTKACAERDAFRDLAGELVITIARLQFYGAVNRETVIEAGGYKWRVYNDGNNIRAEVIE